METTVGNQTVQMESKKSSEELNTKYKYHTHPKIGILNQLDAFTKAKEAIIKLYSDDQGKKFIHHLIYAYSNKNSYCYILLRNGKYPPRDCLTMSNLKTVYSRESPMEDRSYIDKIHGLDSIEDDNERFDAYKSISSELTKDLSPARLTRVALKSKLTDKILGVDELQALIDFVNEQCESNEVIRKMVNYAKHEMKNEASYNDKLNNLVNKYKK